MPMSITTTGKKPVVLRYLPRTVELTLTKDDQPFAKASDAYM